MTARSYTLTATVELFVQDHDDDTGSLCNVDTTELADVIDGELPTTLWVETPSGNEHGYDVKGSAVTITTGPVRVPTKVVLP